MKIVGSRLDTSHINAWRTTITCYTLSENKTKQQQQKKQLGKKTTKVPIYAQYISLSLREA